jgi:hypothetical protein
MADMAGAGDDEMLHDLQMPAGLYFGGIAGLVDVIDCSGVYESPGYMEGSDAWVLAKPQRLRFRPCRGSLGCFHPIFEGIASRSKAGQSGTDFRVRTILSGMQRLQTIAKSRGSATSPPVPAGVGQIPEHKR